jgi:hypothetical protein
MQGSVGSTMGRRLLDTAIAAWAVVATLAFVARFFLGVGVDAPVERYLYPLMLASTASGIALAALGRHREGK